MIEHVHRDRARRRGGRRAGASRTSARRATLGTRARLARRRPAAPTRSGGSSGSSSTTASTSPTRTRTTGDAALPATRGSGSSRSWIRAGAARPRRQRRHRAPDPQLDLRLAGLRRRGAASTPALERRASAAQARHVRATLTPERNHRTLELYALLIAALALPALDRDGGLRGFALAELDRNLAARLPRRRRPPRGLDALPHDRAALVPRRARERAPLRHRAARTASTPGSRAPCEFALHCHRPDGRIPALSDARHRRLPGAARAGATSCSARPPATPDAELPRRRLLRAAQRLGRRRALPDLRLRPARRRRPRPLRPAERRGCSRPGGRWSSIPGRCTYSEGAAEPAPLVPRHRRAQHGLRRRARPDAVHAQAPARPGRARAASSAARARPASTCSRARRAARLRRACTGAASRSSRRALGHRGPAARRDARTATTCASTSRRTRTTRRGSRATPSARPAWRCAIRGAGADRARARLGRAALRRAPPRARSSARSPTGRDAAFVTEIVAPSRDARRPTPPSRGATRCSTAPRSARALGAERCERTYAKYRVGESLRVVHRTHGRHHVAGAQLPRRRGAAPTSARCRRRAGRPAAAVLHAPELDAVLLDVPQRPPDRRAAAAGRAEPRRSTAARPARAPRRGSSPTPPSGRPRAACLDARRPRARLREGPRRRRRRARAPRTSGLPALGAGAPPARAAAAGGDGASARARAARRAAGSTALPGAPSSRAGAAAALGAALADAARPAPAGRRALRARCDPERLARAVGAIATARPAAGRAAARAARALLGRHADAAGPPVCLHGDANPRNALLDGDRVCADRPRGRRRRAGRRRPRAACSPGCSRDARARRAPAAAEERALADALLRGYAARRGAAATRGAALAHAPRRCSRAAR